MRSVGRLLTSNSSKRDTVVKFSVSKNDFNKFASVSKKISAISLSNQSLKSNFDIVLFVFADTRTGSGRLTSIHEVTYPNPLLSFYDQ